MMTIHVGNLLTPEEFASLIELALRTPAPKIPDSHLTKLIDLGYGFDCQGSPCDWRRIDTDQ
jgi:hypothetical protein